MNTVNTYSPSRPPSRLPSSESGEVLIGGVVVVLLVRIVDLAIGVGVITISKYVITALHIKILLPNDLGRQEAVQVITPTRRSHLRIVGVVPVFLHFIDCRDTVILPTVYFFSLHVLSTFRRRKFLLKW